MTKWEAGMQNQMHKPCSNVGIKTKMHCKMMESSKTKTKVKVLLAQALFGNPDVLILDEPTNDLDIDITIGLEDFLKDLKTR